MLKTWPGVAARRQGHGLSATQAAEKVAEAAHREQETQQQLDGVLVDRGRYASARQNWRAEGARAHYGTVASQPLWNVT